MERQASENPQAGFILLDVIVAFIIAALALAGLFSIASASLRSVQVASTYEDALSRARSHLAAAGRGLPLVPGEQRGDDGGGYRWEVRVTPVATAPLARPAARPVPLMVLYSVVVGISWRDDGHRRNIWLQGARIAAAPTRAP